MQITLAVISAVVTLAGLAFKVWRQRRDNANLVAELAAEKGRADTALLALIKEREASRERSKYVNTLESSIRDHLKSCDRPLADWANSLLKNPKKPNDS